MQRLQKITSINSDTDYRFSKLLQSAPEMADNSRKMTDEFIKKVLEEKEAFIKSKFEEKGFGGFLENAHKVRFPKVRCVSFNRWQYYFADDGSDEGAFIVAIEDFDINFPVNRTGASLVSFAFNWQDSHCHPVRINTKWPNEFD